MTDNSKEQLRSMAQELAAESIVTKALGRYIEQLVRCLHKDIIRPIEVENARLRAELERLEKARSGRNNGGHGIPVPVSRRTVPDTKHGLTR